MSKIYVIFFSLYLVLDNFEIVLLVKEIYLLFI